MVNKVCNMDYTVSILGCGWLGLPLGKVLAENCIKVKGSTTQSEKLDVIRTKGLVPHKLDMTNPPEFSDFFQTDVLIITIPPSARQYTTIIANIIKAIEANQIRKVIFISSTTVYPDLNREVTEADAQNMASPRSGIKLLEIEDLFRHSKSFSTTILRFGGLYGPGREPGRFIAGRRGIKGAAAPVNLIHLDDCIGVIKTILKKKIWGATFNACAPQHPSKKEFYSKACNELGLPLPQFVPGPHTYKIVSSKKLVTALNYKFQHPDPME